jgi:hypothetical protein
MNRIIVNGQDFTLYATGQDDINESFAIQKNGHVTIGQATTVTFTDLGYEYLKELFLENACTNKDKDFPVTITISNCRMNLQFVMKSQGVSIDTINCRAKVNLNTKNTPEEKYEILNQSYFWDEKYKYLDYALKTGNIHKMISVFEVGLASKIFAVFWFNILVYLLKFWNLIVETLNTISFDVFDLDQIQVDVDQVSTDVLGGGEYSTPCNVKSIFTHWAGVAGLNFKSPILQSNPYDKMALWSQIVDSGLNIGDHKTQHIDYDNLPNISSLQLLNMLKPVFNADHVIIGNDLIFDRKDKIDNLKKRAFNLDAEIRKRNIKGDVVYTFNNSTYFARFKGSFAQDAIDIQGNRAIPFYRYNHDYNIGRVHKNRKGDNSPDIQFGALRCTDDFARDGLLSYEYRNLNPSHTHSIVLENVSAQLPKLIIIDSRDTVYEGTNFKTTYREQIAAPKQNQPGQPDLTGDWEYNRPLWMKTLYDNFHYIDDPDINESTFIEIHSLTWTPDDFCQAVEFMRENMLNTYIESANGKGFITSFEILYKECSIRFKQIRFKCTGFAR